MYIRVKVSPNARRELLTQESESTFFIAVREKAQAGQANRRVLELLAQHFKLPSARFRIINGHHHCVKLISFENAP